MTAGKNLKLLMVLIALLLLWQSASSAPPSRIKIQADEVTVSGISAGAQMAHQLHFAYPELFSGVALLATAPFGCAGGSLVTAMSNCMGTAPADMSVAELVKTIRKASSEGRLGETEKLKDDKVWVFHATLDTTVAAQLSDATIALYESFIPKSSIRQVSDIEAAHLFPTLESGRLCTKTAPPFIGNCGYDTAGELLSFLYDMPREATSSEQGELVETILTGSVEVGLQESAYLYIPAACARAGQACKGHLVLHGCGQSVAQIGKTFILQSGFLNWADRYQIIMAFPQVAPSVSNPLACWDWWGYTGANYLWRDGAQMKTLADWITSMSE